MQFNQVQPILPAPAIADSIEPVQSIGVQRELITAVTKVNGSELLCQDEELTFQMDREAGVPVIRLVNRNTKEVVRQIPPEYVLSVAKALEDGQ
jgi:flagellar protein FlaG